MMRAILLNFILASFWLTKSPFVHYIIDFGKLRKRLLQMPVSSEEGGSLALVCSQLELSLNPKLILVCSNYIIYHQKDELPSVHHQMTCSNL